MNPNYSRVAVLNSLESLSTPSRQRRPLDRIQDLITVLKAGDFKLAVELLKIVINKNSELTIERIFGCHTVEANSWTKMGSREVKFFVSESGATMAAMRTPGCSEEQQFELSGPKERPMRIAVCSVSDNAPFAVLKFSRSSRRSGITQQSAFLVSFDFENNKVEGKTLLSASRLGRMRPNPKFFSDLAVQVNKQGDPEVIVNRKGRFSTLNAGKFSEAQGKFSEAQGKEVLG